MKVDTNDLTVSELPRDDILRTFSTAKSIAGKDSKTVRCDECGNEIHLEDYERETEFGWQIALITNEAATDKRNFRPMHFANVTSRSG